MIKLSNEKLIELANYSETLRNLLVDELNLQLIWRDIVGSEEYHHRRYALRGEVYTVKIANSVYMWIEVIADGKIEVIIYYNDEPLDSMDIVNVFHSKVWDSSNWEMIDSPDTIKKLTNLVALLQMIRMGSWL